MAKSINHQFFFPHPPAAVWEYLTRAELLELWLMKNDFLPVVGHEFQFRISPIPQMDFDGVVYCKVLEVVSHERLCYSWKSGNGDGVILVDSIVQWQLVPKDNGTELVLEHSGFAETVNTILFSSITEGWLKNMHKMNGLITAAHAGTNA